MNEPDEPEKTFCRDMLLGFELVDDEVLDGGGFAGSGSLALTEFLDIESLACSVQASLLDGGRGSSYLDVAEHVGLDGGKGYRAQSICWERHQVSGRCRA